MPQVKVIINLDECTMRDELKDEQTPTLELFRKAINKMGVGAYVVSIVQLKSTD